MSRSHARKDYRWQAEVAKKASSINFDPGTFSHRSIKHAATPVRRSKKSGLRSILSVANFYLSRASKQITLGRRAMMEKAKAGLRKVASLSPI